MVKCPGVKIGNKRTKPHPTSEDNFHVNQTYCKDCKKELNAYYNIGSYKRKYNTKSNPRRYMKYPSDLNCVYRHVDPETKEIKYIGEGSIHRAYEFTSRQIDHAQWFETLLRKGFKPTDIVKVKRYNLTKSQSLNLEYSLIYLYKKKYNNLFNKEKK